MLFLFFFHDHFLGGPTENCIRAGKPTKTWGDIDHYYYYLLLPSSSFLRLTFFFYTFRFCVKREGYHQSVWARVAQVLVIFVCAQCKSCTRRPHDDEEEEEAEGRVGAFLAGRPVVSGLPFYLIECGGSV